MVSAGKALIVVENNSVPFDRRVWREARALRDAGWKVTVICPRSPSDDRLAHAASAGSDAEILDGIRIERFPLRFAEHGAAAYAREYLAAWLHIARLSWRVLRRDDFDVIQFCNPPDLFFPLGFYYRLLGRAVIFDHHDLFPEGVRFRFRGTAGAIAARVALLAERLTFASADVVMATNESYRSIARGRGGMAGERVIVVRNGPELGSFRPVAPVPALKDGFAHLVCYLGIMGEDDGIEAAVEAMRYVIAERGRDDVRFVLIGDGAMRGWAVRRIEELGLGRQVTFTGRLPEADVLAYLSTCDLGMSPDACTPVNSLSTMNKVMEYMALGKPVVSFDLKEARVSAGDAGTFVPCGDAHAFGRAILDLLDDPARCARMGEAGRRRVTERLAWDHQKGALLDAYAAALRIRRARQHAPMAGIAPDHGCSLASGGRT